jgi:hypothetical protein
MAEGQDDLLARGARTEADRREAVAQEPQLPGNLALGTGRAYVPHPDACARVAALDDPTGIRLQSRISDGRNDAAISA